MVGLEAPALGEGTVTRRRIASSARTLGRQICALPPVVDLYTLQPVEDDKRRSFSTRGSRDLGRRLLSPSSLWKFGSASRSERHVASDMEQPCLGLLHFFQTMLPHTRFRLAARAPPESTWSCTRGHLSRNATWLLAWSRLNRALFTSSSTSRFLTGASRWQHVLHWTRLGVTTRGHRGGKYALAARA